MSVPNKERIQLWIDALRSGEYTQIQGALRQPDGYCCLGVACDIYHTVTGLGYWGVGAGPHRYAFTQFSADLPPQVVQWFGLEASDPKLHLAEPEPPYDREQYITNLNDILGKSFKEIADLIEAKYLLQ